MSDQTPDPVRYAREAAEAVRQINHLTLFDSGGLDRPRDVYDAVRALAEAVERLPQALGQLARAANSLGDLRDDRGPHYDTGVTLDDVTRLLVDSDATRLGKQLRSAAEQLSHLGSSDA